MILLLATACLVAAICCALVRIGLGPTWADRLIALDFLGSTLAVLFVLNALLTGFDAFIDVALLMSLLGFLTSIALARYMLEDRVIR